MSDEAAAEQVERDEDILRPQDVLRVPPLERYTLKSGVVLKLRAIPAAVAIAIQQKVERPTPPVVAIPDQDREEANPNDPDYLKALQEYDVKLAHALIDASLLLGVEVESVPDGVCKVEDSEWVDDLTFLDIDLQDNDDPRRRKLNWLRYYAVRGPTELGIVQGAIISLGNLTEQEVAEAIDTFRRNVSQRADQLGRTPPAGVNGNRATRRAVRNRT